MDKIDWEILNCIDSFGTITRVSEILFISQPAISYRMAKMEKEFQVPLFLRGNRGVTLTDAGKRLNSYSRQMLQYDYEIMAAVQQKETVEEGNIIIGSTSTFMIYYLADQLLAFSELYKNIKIDVILDSSPSLFQKLTERSLLISIIRGNTYSNWSGEQMAIFKEPLLIIANEPITMDYLQRTPMIRNSTSISRAAIDYMIDDWISKYFPVPPKRSPLSISGDSRVIVKLVKNGFGWSVITGSRLLDSDGLFNQILFKTQNEPYYYETRLLYAKEASLTKPYLLYLTHLKHYFKRFHSGTGRNIA